MLRKILAYAGLAIGTSSISLLAAAAYGLVARPDELFVVEVFAGFGLAYVAMGLLLSRIRTPNLTIGDGILLTALVWITVPALTGLPLSLVLDIPFIDAYYESVGGWTTTGLTIMSGEPSSWDGRYVPAVSELPETVKVWRSVMQWLGGLGIVIFTIALLARPGISAAVLYVAEARYERLEASLKRSAILLGTIYTIVTLVSILLLYASGMKFIDAFHFALTGISTAGFSPYTESIAFYIDNNAILASSLIVSFLGAMSFADHHNILTLRLSRLKESIELKLQLVLVALAVASSYLLWIRDPVLRDAYTLKQAVYDTLSAFTTVGFQSGPLGDASDAFKLLLIGFSAIGGSAFSTAGGIKVLRLAITLKVLAMEARMILAPVGYVPMRKIGKYYVDEDLIRRTMATISVFVLAYAALTGLALILYSSIYSAADIAFEVASGIFNIGLSTGISSAAAPTGMKLILASSMLMGRLEVMVFLVAAIHLVASIKKAI